MRVPWSLGGDFARPETAAGAQGSYTRDGRLPLIVPVVLAQNAQPWVLPHEFGTLFDLPPELADEARSFVPDFTFQLVQLAELPFEKIVGTPAGILVLRTLMGLPPAEPESLSALPVSELRLRFDELRRDYDARFRR